MSLNPTSSFRRCKALRQSIRGSRRVVPKPPRAAMAARASGSVSAQSTCRARWSSSPARYPSAASTPSATSGTYPDAESRAIPRASRPASTGPAGAQTAITSPFRNGSGLRIGPPGGEEVQDVRGGEQQGGDEDRLCPGIAVGVEDRVRSAPRRGPEGLYVDAEPPVEERLVRPDHAACHGGRVAVERHPGGEILRVP